MALELKIKETEVQNNSIVIENDTGIFAVDTNEGGFRTPNPNRYDLKLFLKTFHVTKEGLEEVVNPAPYDSLDVESWTETGIKDGHKMHYIVGINITGDVPSDVDVHAFLDAADLDTLQNDSQATIGGYNYVLYITKTNTFPIPQAKIDRIEANERCVAANCACENCSEETKAETREFYFLLRSLMESAVHNFNVGNYVRAQRIIEKANEIGEQLYEES